MNRRSAFVFLPLVIALGISLAVLGVIYGSNAPAKMTSSAAYNSGNKSGAMFGMAIFAAFMVWVSGRFAERRGTGSANAIFGGILLLANIAVGINAYRVTLGSQSGKATQVAKGGATSGGTTAAPTTRPAPVTRSPVMVGGGNPGVPPPGVTPVPADPEPSPATTPQTLPTPEAGPAPIAPVIPPTPAARPADPTPKEERNPKAQPIIDATRARLEASAKTSADATDTLLKVVAKPPAHDKRVLKDRASDAELLRGQLTKTGKEMRDVRDTLEKELVGAGVDTFEASRLSTSFMIDFDANSRAFACERLLTTVDHVKEECDVLDKNFAAWVLTKGEITPKDPKNFKLRQELTKPRFFIESGCKQAPDVLKSLRGG